jgi:hypothetical protein
MGIIWNLFMKVGRHNSQLLWLNQSMKYEHAMCWANDIKQKRLLGGNPSQKKKNHIYFLFPLSFIFPILLYFCHSPIFLFFYFNIEDNVVFKVWGYWENFGFLCCFLKKKKRKNEKKSLSFIFWTPIGLWEYEYYVWELVERDDNINWMNESRDWLWKHVMLTL